MNLNYFFNNSNLESIFDFNKSKVSEDIFLEFKTANFPKSLEYDKKNFSKCLSGFSNSAGGILIWGVKASKNEKELIQQIPYTLLRI